MANINAEKLLDELKAKVVDDRIRNAIEKFQNTLQYSQFLQNLAKCLKPNRLSAYFVYVMNNILWRTGIIDAKAKVIVTDEKTYVILEEETRHHGQLPNGQRISTEYINVSIINNILNVKDVEAFVYVKNKKLREKAIATLLAISKHHKIKMMNVNDKEIEEIMKKWPWLKRDVKGILNVFISKVKKSGCMTQSQGSGENHAKEGKG